MKTKTTIFRKKHGDHYTIIPNELLRDKALSFKARGLLGMVLSNRDDWVVHQRWLIQQTPGEGREAIAGAMHELEMTGYAVYSEERNPGSGRLEIAVWTFHDEPVLLEKRTSRTGSGGKALKSPCYGLPCHGEPSHGLPSHSGPCHGFPATKNNHDRRPLSEGQNKKEAEEAERPSPPASASRSVASQLFSASRPSEQGKGQTDIDRFVQGWTDLYPKVFGRPYVPGVDDYKHTKTLLSSSGSLTVRSAIAVAIRAWAHLKVQPEDDGWNNFFQCQKNSLTIRQFVKKWQEITNELKFKFNSSDMTEETYAVWLPKLLEARRPKAEAEVVTT